MTNIEVNDDVGYQLSTDLSSEAIEWVRQQQSLTPDKPFFIYYAPRHSPHHASGFVNKYKGLFDKGWDQVRNDTPKQQIDRGVVPNGTQLANKPRSVPDWDTLSDDQEDVCPNEVFGFVGSPTMRLGDYSTPLTNLGTMIRWLSISPATTAPAEGNVRATELEQHDEWSC